MSENDPEALNLQLPVAKAAFKDFEAAHDIVCKTLTTEAEIEKNADYFSNAELNYIQAIAMANEWLNPKNDDVFDDKIAPTPVTDPSIMQAHMIDILNKPRINIDCFTGDPIQYNEFITVFDQAFCSDAFSVQVRLTHLLQFTSGVAKSSIKHTRNTTPSRSQLPKQSPNTGIW